jgi:pSer/pThr/pTyr-binding forkhead associated (FHA) protein
MGDPRLNSIHLEPSRRQLFRQAREVLLDARGQHTVCAEKSELESSPFPCTIIQDKNVQKSADLLYWLQDQEDCIYPLKVGVNTVGRSDDNDVVVQDSYVSRRHCAILVHVHNGCELHDTASKNGTFLNGDKLIGPTRLKPGDEIRMCGKQLTFRSRNDNPPAHPNTMTLSA